MDRHELLAAGDANLAATMRLHARTAPGATMEEGDGLLLFSTAPRWPSPYHNGAIRLDPDLAPAEVLGRAAAFFAGRAPGYCVWIAAHADTDLEEAALAAGHPAISPEGTPRLALDHPLAPPEPPGGVTLDEVTDEAGRLEYLEVTVQAYADSFLPPDAAEAHLGGVGAVCGPEVRSVVAHLEGRPVAAAMVVLSGPVAGIQLVGTVPGARRRGLGELCTRWAVERGFAAGAEAIVLEASEDGDPVYRRMGFTEISRYRWCFGPPAPGAGDGGRGHR